MSWDALRDRDSGRPRRNESRPSQSVAPSVRTQARAGSVGPRSRSLRAAEKPVAPIDVVPAAIEEELWFGGHDATIAEDAAARSMAALVGRIVGAKPFPESARKLAELTRKDVLRIEPIIQVLERDPGLSARLLRLVNSAGYALRQRCTSVRHAATLVGTDRLHQIATTAAVLDLFDARGSAAAKIIEHSTIVGAFCRYFGAHLALPVDDLFTAGFLHDIGKLMLLETEGDQYFALLEKYADRPDSIHVVERSLFGFDHAVLAAHVLTEWNIPDPVPKIVAWHHDPTRAYRVSSMMAALVQTVRLADLAVYAMVSDVTQEQFATLASTESASYLDISEPQLSSMWDELQTLYRESVEQCRGENAPALDPRSLRPKQPITTSISADAPRSTELPLQFPCVVCGKPSFGNTCRACGGHMCPEHQEGREDWCSLCARDFYREANENPVTLSPRLAAAIALVTVLISSSIGYETGGASGGLRAAVGTVLLLILVALLAVSGRRLLLRFRFVRTRPDRAVDEPQESFGGTHSLVPPTTDTPSLSIMSHHDPLTEQLRLSGAAIDRVMIREVPSIPSILAPKPFEGLTEAHPPSSRRMGVTSPSAFAPFPTAAPTPAAIPQTTRAALDDERLALQGRSLVTLPVPSRAEQPSAVASAPIRPSESIDVESDDRISELGINVLDATPQSEPPFEASSLEPPSLTANRSSESAPPSTQQRRGSGTYPSSPPPAMTEPEPQPTVSHHPLAALGLNPTKYDKLTIQRERETQTATESDAPVTPITEPPTAERPTLLGLSADEVRQALATPLVPEQTQSVSAPTPPEPDWALSATNSEPEPVSTPQTQVAVTLDVAPASPSVPEQAPAHATNVSDLSRPLPPATAVQPALPDRTSVEQQLLASMGPEFQAQVMTLVAERVAAIIAERMLGSLGQGTQQLHPTGTPRTTRTRKVAKSTEPSATPPKASRRKAPHG